MKNPIRNTLVLGLLTALLAAAPGFAQSRHKHMPSEEVLATIPGLTQAQRDTIFRIETEQRAEHKALLEAERSAHQAIKEQTTAELRAELGDDAYATYAAWKLEQRAERKHTRHQRRGGRGAPMDNGDESSDATTEG
ncbi:hypothetical protein [Dokdonella sp.]|uniref:hypothetical protein n=1 Tax=Dokdonella sp. TaxID=2291710 RepID=UPI003C389FF9